MTPAGGCGGSFKCTDLFDRNNAPLTSPAGTTINESQFFKPPPCKVVFFLPEIAVPAPPSRTRCLFSSCLIGAGGG